MASENETGLAPADNSIEDPTRRPQLVAGRHGLSSITNAICGIVEAPRASLAWKVAFAVSATLAFILLLLVCYLFWEGVGVWGVRIPVAWGFAIVNFVFWVGIGHAGTLISAILYLCRQHWRTGINRFAEAMTIFAVICAGLFPAIHVGRPWVEYWMAPYPNQMGLWPQFRSPLLWDAFAVSTYFTVSLIFWYTGMIPDLAALRDRAKTGRGRLFTAFWRWAGAAPAATGKYMSAPICCSPRWRRRWF